MKKLILNTFLFIVLLCAASSSYALDFIKFGTSHDDDFWDNPDNELAPFPSTVQYLRERGKNEIVSIALTDGNVQDVFGGNFGAFDAIVVSERIENKLSPDSYALFNEYVSGGGCVIVTGDHGNGEDEFLNNSFGYSVSVTSVESGVDTFAIQSTAFGTAFSGGPSSLIAANKTSAFSNTPGAEIYSGSTGVAVFTDEFGDGTVNVIGWDYCCTPPDDRNAISAWYEVVNRAFDQCSPTPHPVVPTLSEWGLMAMAGILGISGLLFMMRRRVTA